MKEKDLELVNIKHLAFGVIQRAALDAADGSPTAARAAYYKGMYTAVRLAGEFDQDIADLLDHLSTYGELANLNQKMFMRFSLAKPEAPDAKVPALR